MREYEGFGGNVLFLDSKKVIARTQYIEEECSMDQIYDASYHAPNFTKNGCLSITTENNVIPIYFLPKHSNSMIEAFGIIEALASKRDRPAKEDISKTESKLGTLKCVEVDHPILRAPGRMNLLLLSDGVRFEYAMANQGYTIPFSEITQVLIMDARGELRSLHEIGDNIRESVIDAIRSEKRSFLSLGAARLYITYTRQGKDGCLSFEGKGCEPIGESLINAYVSWCNHSQSFDVPSRIGS